MTAILLANGLLSTIFAKTSHGLIRGPSRYRILGVVDPATAGRDAGEVLDGVPRGIPVAATVGELLAGPAAGAGVAIVGVATEGGVLPDGLRASLADAARAGLTLVNGLHQLLADDPEIAALAAEGGAEIVDLRRPRATRELRFWSGRIDEVVAPRVAVLGTDCAIGKRTTCSLLVTAFRDRGLRAEMIYTGQTGWLQGFRHGFILDATPNDFVSGELERAILDCAQQARPDVILLEGQSALRNPSGPCGSELIVSARAAAVVLQHAPGRTQFEALGVGCPIPPLGEELELVRLLGSEVLALTLNDEDVVDRERVRAELRDAHGRPVVYPLRDGVGEVVDVLRERLGLP